MRDEGSSIRRGRQGKVRGKGKKKRGGKGKKKGGAECPRPTVAGGSYRAARAAARIRGSSPKPGSQWTSSSLRNQVPWRFEKRRVACWMRGTASAMARASAWLRSLCVRTSRKSE